MKYLIMLILVWQIYFPKSGLFIVFTGDQYSNLCYSGQAEDYKGICNIDYDFKINDL